MQGDEASGHRVELRPGETFAGYRVEGIVGRGGMGVVYRVTEPSLGRSVALKVVAPGLADDQHARRRFFREARAAAAIEHPNVIPVHAVGEQDGLAFLSMRLIAGDLRTLVRRTGALPPDRAAHLVEQVAAALDAAHRAGLVHRDVKPGNVLVADHDHAYLADFGLAAFLDSSSASSSAGHWVGTPDYAAPEQIRGDRLDARTDVYALGCLLVFLLTGHPPFERDGAEAKLWAHLAEPPPSVASPAFDAVIARALAKQPADRYESAGDLGRAARAAAAGQRDAPEIGSVAVGAAARSGMPDAPTVPQPPDRGERRVGRRVAIVLVALVAAAGGLVFALVAGTDDSRRRAGSPPATPTPTAARLSPRRAASVSAGHRPTSLALAGGRLWVAERRRPQLHVFTAGSLRRRATTTLASGVAQLAATDSAVWAALWRAGAVVRLDERSARAVGTAIHLPERPSTLTVGHGGLWVGLAGRGGPAAVMRIDPRTGAVLWSRQLPTQTDRLVWFRGALWAMVSTPNRLFRLDPDTGETMAYIILPGGDAGDLTAAGRYLWATVRDPDWLVRIDARTGRKADTYVGRQPTGVAAHGDDVWVALWPSSRIALIDAGTLRKRTRDIDVGLNPFRVVADATGAWVTCAGTGRLIRVRRS